MNLSLFIDEAGELLSAAGAPDRIALLAYILLRDSDVRPLEDSFRAIKVAAGLAPDQEVKSSEYAIATRPVRGSVRRIGHLAHLAPCGVEQLFGALSARVARCPDVGTACVCTHKAAAYDPSWLRRRTSDAVQPSGAVCPIRVFEACYQDLIQRSAKDATVLKASRVSVYVDYNSRFDERWRDQAGTRREDVRRLTEIHARLTRRYPHYSWGQPLDVISDTVSALPSNQYVGLQAADLVAGAFYSWLRGYFPRAYAPLASIVRRPGGLVFRRGITCFPKATPFLDEEACRLLLDRAVQGS